MKPQRHSKQYSLMNRSNAINQSLDLSCFPLLRIDQLQLHAMDILIKSREELSLMVDNDESDDIRKYASKLLDLISQEITARRGHLKFMPDNGNDQDRSSVDQGAHSPRNKNTERIRKSSFKSYRPRSNEDVQVQSTNFVVSSNGSGKSGFRARAKERNSAMRTKNRTNTAEYKKALQEKFKRIRRQKAMERIEKRRARRVAIEARLERRRRKKMEKKKIQNEERNKIQLEMERVVEDAMNCAVETKGDCLDEKQIHVHAASAAAEVLKKAELNILESDSGSSLASEVESLPDAEADVTLEVDDSFSNYSIHTDMNDSIDATEEDFTDGSVTADDDFTTDGVPTSIEDPDVIEQERTELEAHEGDQCKPLPHSIEAEKSLVLVSVIEDTLQYSPAHGDAIQLESNKPKDDLLKVNQHFQLETEDYTSLTNHHPKESMEQIDWQPWSSLKAETVNATCSPSEANTCTRNETAFTNIFPTFNSIFTAFASTGHHDMSDRNMNIERECLEYQGKVLTNLLKLKGSVHQECTSTAATLKKNELLFSTKSVRPEVTTIISDVLLSDQQDQNWKDMSSELCIGNCWNLLWTWKKPKLNPEHLLVWQRISRFPNTSCLTRKDYLKKHLESKMAQCKSSSSHSGGVNNVWNIMPLTYVLPNEFTSFLSSFSSIQKNCESNDNNNDINSNLWIMKPVGMSRGRGITLINDIGQVTYSTPTVIQNYLTNPLLFHGFKFDLRLYVLVTSFSPLEAFLYEEGFARFGSRPFSSRAETLNDFQIHLTNSSIQKNYNHDISKATHPARIAGKDGGGNKVTLSWLWKRLKSSQGLLLHDTDIDMIWKNIQELCLRTLMAVGDKIPHQPNAFEVFGFDVILDEELKPWLIEVNACPALSRENDLDSIVKGSLIEDTLKIVSPPNYNREALAEICHRRLCKKKRSRSQKSSDRDILDQDLRRILDNELPRQYGEEPKASTGYQRLAPGLLFDQLT